MEEEKRRQKKMKNEQNPRGPWLSVRQAAEYLSMKPRAVRELEHRGILPGRRLGRTLRFDLRELDRFLAERRQPTMQEVLNKSQRSPEYPLGPLVNPEAAAVYLSLPSPEALLKRVARMQVAAYRLSERILRFRPAELDQAMNYKSSLTRKTEGRIFEADACLPEGKEASE